MLHVKHYRRLPMAGLVVAALAVLILGLRPDTLALPAVAALLGAIGLGLGTVLPVTTVAIQNAVALHELGTATAAMGFFRSLGGALIVAGFGAILLGMIGGTDIGGLRSGAADPAMNVKLADGFGWVFVSAAIGLLAALVFLLLMKELPLKSRVSGGPPVPAEA
jgi:MFS family permease